jgi:hypothetical protein
VFYVCLFDVSTVGASSAHCQVGFSVPLGIRRDPLVHLRASLPFYCGVTHT